MHILKQKIVPIFFIASQCLVLYALWPQTKYLLQKKNLRYAHPSTPSTPYKMKRANQNKLIKKQNSALFIAALFNIRKKQKLKKLVVLTRNKTF